MACFSPWGDSGRIMRPPQKEEGGVRIRQQYHPVEQETQAC